MKLLFTAIFCLIFPQFIWAASDLLYTGNAVTVTPGQTQLISYFDSSFGGPQRVAGGSLTHGIAKRSDVKLGYGYLWNNIGADVRLGPNFGLKWRFIGDAKLKPSVAVSSLVSINEGVGGKSHKNDYGSLVIVQYPTKPIIYLLNLGRVWIGDNNKPDMFYLGFAAARYLHPHTLIALEYNMFERIHPINNIPKIDDQVAVGLVYSTSHNLNYGIQYGYLPHGKNIHMHMTFGISTYF